MSETNVTEIKSLNGYPLADTKARKDIATLSEEIGEVEETLVDYKQGVGLDYIELIPAESAANLLDGVEWTGLGYIREEMGNLSNNSYVTTYRASDFIPVQSGKTYRVTASDTKHMTIGYVTFPDTKTNGTVVSATFCGSGSSKEITIPDGHVYISLNANINTDKYDIPAELVKTTIDLSDSHVRIPRLVSDKFAKPSNAGYVIVNMGDSIFGNWQDETSISAQLADMTKATVYNCAFGGCRMSDWESAVAPFSMCNLATAIASGDFTAQETAAAGGTLSPTFVEKVNILKSIDFSKVNIMTIAYGTNDWANWGILDDEEDKMKLTTYAGALRYSIETIGAAYPNIRFLICTPMFRCWFENGVLSEDSDTKTTGRTETIPDFVDTAKAVAVEYHLLVCDFYNELGLNKFSWPVFFNVTDGTHPHAEGRKLMAKKLAQVLAGY